MEMAPIMETQPTYSFAENGSGGLGYYETVTSVTEVPERVLERLSHSRSMRLVLRAQGIITQLLLMEPPGSVFIMGLMSLRALAERGLLSQYYATVTTVTDGSGIYYSLMSLRMR